MPNDSTYTVNSNPIYAKHKITFKTSTIWYFLAVIGLLLIAFFGGIIYQKNSGSIPSSYSAFSSKFHHKNKLKIAKKHHKIIRLKGTIQSISGSSISILVTKTNKNRTLKTNSRTIVRINGQKSTLSQLTVNEQVVVLMNHKNHHLIRLIIEKNTSLNSSTGA